MKVGVLSVQGAFAEMEAYWRGKSAEVFEIRQPADLDHGMDLLALPGGESTVQGKLLKELGLFAPLKQAIDGGLPVFATCAGLILLAARIEDGVEDGRDRSGVRPARHLGTLDVTVVRNAYGRQLGSFHARGAVAGVGDDVPMTFIRAPYVAEVGPGAEELARVDGRVVAVRQGAQLAVAFHPELDRDRRIHEAFLAL